MRALLVLLVTAGLLLAGCTSREGQPELPAPYTGPLVTGEDGGPTPPTTTGTQDPAPEPTDGPEPDPPAAEDAVFELSIEVGNVSGPAPANVLFTFDVVSEHRKDQRQIYHTFTIDFSGDGEAEVSGDSRGFIARDKNGTLQYESPGRPIHQPLELNRTFSLPGVYNVTLKAQRYVASGVETKETTAVVVIQASRSALRAAPPLWDRPRRFAPPVRAVPTATEPTAAEAAGAPADGKGAAWDAHSLGAARHGLALK